MAMKQKTLNKMAKYCQLEDMRFGQLLDILVLEWPYTQSTAGLVLFHITDKDLETRFLDFYKTFPPKKDRGGYYPHGHRTNNAISRSDASLPAVRTRNAGK